MNDLLKYLLYSATALVAFVVLGVLFLPDYNFVQYVTESIWAGLAAVAVLTIIALWKEDKLEDSGKKTLMWLFALAIIIPTLYTAGAFVHRTQTTWSAGEIHWHADYEVIVKVEGRMADKLQQTHTCREDGDGYLCQLDLLDPSKFCESTTHEASYMCILNDRTGATEFHEHDDRRIHWEGVFDKREDATLASFFETFGGELSKDKLVYPTNEGWVNLTAEGDKEVQIFVKAFVDGNYRWKIADEEYVAQPYQQQPLIDELFIIYDSTPVDEAMQDLKDDNNYKGFGLEKASEGY